MLVDDPGLRDQLGPIYRDCLSMLWATIYKDRLEVANAARDDPENAQLLRVQRSAQHLADHFEEYPLLLFSFVQFDPTGGAIARARDPWVASYRKIDDYTIEISNPRPLSYFPGALAYLFFSSPAQFQKTGSWAEFAKAPSGTGPFKITEFKPRVSATLSRNEGYWDPNRVPKLDKMVLFPMPEATRPAARRRSRR